MKRKGTKFLSLALAFTLAASPMAGLHAYAAGPGAAGTAQETQALPDAAPQDGSPTKPVLPGGFSGALEDAGGLTLTSGAASTQLNGCGKAIQVTTHWNNQNGCHASINNAESLFKRKAFTVLLDVRQDPPSGDPNVTEQRTALTIGTAEKNLHLLTYSGKFGYGEKAISDNQVALAGVEKDGWNAVAMTYEEPNNGNGRIVIYVNGQKAGEAADIGFKLSSLDGLEAMLARTFHTNYLQEGLYDNLVVGDSVLDEATAIAETAYRKYAKDNLAAGTGSTLVTIKGSDVDAAVAKPNGLAYKGFGMLNGNSTSNLLLDYKYENRAAYDEMMQYLFGGQYPLFTHIKMEMGNDGNNSTGAEACTMRYEEEEADASRSPGFVMAADAKKINPNVKISILRWEMPNWVKAKWDSNTDNQGYEAMYRWYKETIFDAYEKYGYVVDFVNPDKNETGNPDNAFIKWFSNRVKGETDFPSYMDAAAQAAYKGIRIIASDENKGLKIVPNMRADQDLYQAVDIIGFHYRTNATDDYVTMADADDKEVWYSEGCATFGYSELQENKTIEYGANSIGGYQSPLALMDSFITAFASSRRTHYIFQPAIGSFYEGIQYGHKELLSARDPWSGYIHYDPALTMLEHFAKFAKTGWEDSDPAQDDIWRAIPGATSSAFAGSDNEHATAGINGNAGCLTLASPDKKDFSVVFVNNTKNAKSFFINTQDMAVTAKALRFWLTETDKYMQDKGTIESSEEGWYVTLPPYSIATATTLDTDPGNVPKADIHNEDRTVLDTDATGHNNGVTDDGILYADDFEYREEPAGYLEERGKEPRYMLDTHGAWIVENGELKQELSSSVPQWNGGDPSTVVGDFRWMDYSASANIRIPNASASTYARLTIRSQTGMNWNNSGYTLNINGAGKWELYRIGTKVDSGSAGKNADGRYEVTLMALGSKISVLINGENVANYEDPTPMLSGRVKLSSSWDQVYFDDLLVKAIDGGIPYALSMVDGQDDSVSYEGAWAINNPGRGDADNWYRTMSSTSTAGSSFSFPISGAGFAILGSNDGSATLDVYADGNLMAENAATLASPARGETYSFSGLENGAHTIQVVVKSGALNIDALYALGSRLPSSDDALVSVTTEIPSIDTLVTGSSAQSLGLPTEVDVVTAGNQTLKKGITWDTSDRRFEGKEFQPAFLTGTVQGGVTSSGLPLTVPVPVNMVIPSGTVYFIDSVDGTPAANATTEPYEAIKALLGDHLLNQASDQFKTDGNSWGLKDRDAGTKSHNGTADLMATGLYGAKNEPGETLTYEFALPAGEYKLVSGHREWWKMDRPMAASLLIDGQAIDAGAINLSNSSGDIYNTFAFTVPESQTLAYTLTSTGKEAPVISFLAVINTSGKAHTHELTTKDNGNGTHTTSCKDGDYIFTENHEYSRKDNNNGTHTVSCKACGYSSTANHNYAYTDNGDGTHGGACKDCGSRSTASHNYAYTDNGNGTHGGACKDCGSAITENHAYANGACTLCKAKEPAAHKHSYTYKDSKDGKTHTAACKDGDDTRTEPHVFQGSTCSLCGYKKPAPVTAPGKPSLASPVNEGKGIKVSWKKVSGASGYYIQRKAGNGKWTAAKTITKASITSWTDAKANKNGIKYQYRICAYKGSTKVKGSYSAVKATFRLDAKPITSLKNSKGRKMALKWGKNTKASGYQLQYSTSSKFKAGKTLKVSGASKNSRTISSGLKKGKKYYVRIRCFKKSGTVTSYSAWSKAKSIKIKK
ncbi:MAG: hypothetical protein HFH38_02395 [Lachnospiraceae bacterium]|jgi:hypothetical protein|nr:hypothetical protein [Lachnospiraceae bacterium]